jgi:hypothetical protein
MKIKTCKKTRTEHQQFDPIFFQRIQQMFQMGAEQFSSVLQKITANIPNGCAMKSTALISTCCSDSRWK